MLPASPSSFWKDCEDWVIGAALFVQRMFSSRIALPRDHDGGAGAPKFRQIAICRHANLEPLVLPAGDRTIKIRLR